MRHNYLSKEMLLSEAYDYTNFLRIDNEILITYLELHSKPTHVYENFVLCKSIL